MSIEADNDRAFCLEYCGILDQNLWRSRQAQIDLGRKKAIGAQLRITTQLANRLSNMEGLPPNPEREARRQIVARRLSRENEFFLYLNSRPDTFWRHQRHYVHTNFRVERVA